ncbi:MAG: glycosyltransferase family 39 protein [Anaerolineales bacterium]|nr:glycosyltransferase family 39 protein [Anaerolineales bacterium]
MTESPFPQPPEPLPSPAEPPAPQTPAPPALRLESPSPNTHNPSPQRRITAAAAVLLVLTGFLLLYSYPTEPEKYIPLAMGFIAAGVFLFLLTLFLKPSAAEIRHAASLKIPSRGAWIVTGVVLSILATVMMLAFLQFDRQNYIPVITMWFGAAVCYLTAFAGVLPARADLSSWWRMHWKECLAVGLITLLAAALRFYKLGEIPRTINGDEGWLGNIAISSIHSPYANPFSLWQNFGGLYLQTINLGMLFFGVSPFSLRLMPAIAGTLAIPALYLFARQIAGKRIAVLAVLLLAMSHTHLNFSRTVGVGYIQDTWLVPLELYLFLSALQKQSRLRAAAGGLLLGIHFSVYLTPQIFTGMLVVFCILVLLFFRKSFPKAGRIFAVFWGGLAIMLVPEAVFAALHPEDFFERLNLEGTLSSGWLTQQIQATGQSAVQVLVDRVTHAFLSLIYYPAIDYYGSLLPVLSLFTGVFFLIGVGISLWRTRSINHLLLNGYFWVGPLAIGLFSIPATADSYRVLMILPAAILLAAIGLDTILNSIGGDWGRNRATYSGVAAFLLISLFAFNMWTYFVDFAGKCRYGGDRQTRFASYLGRFMADVPPAETVYLLSDDIFRYGTHPSVDFLTGGRLITNLPDPIDAADPASGEILIASPDRIPELYAWIHEHPGGELEAFYDCDILFLLAYHVP